MSLSVVLAMGLLGGAGAVARVLVDGAVSRSIPGVFPFGTLTVNLVGAFSAGVLVGLAVTGDAYRLAALALIGSFTTFSSWMVASDRLAREGRLGVGAANIAVSLVLGLALAWAGRELGAAL